jgi:replicative DNA helicase
MGTLTSLNQYGISFQIKVINSLLKHKEFLTNIYDVLDVEHFDNPAHKWLIEEIVRYYAKYHTTPSLDYLSAEVKKIPNEVLKVSVVEQLKDAYKVINDDQEYVEQEFSNFCRNQQLKGAIFKSIELLEKGDYDSIIQEVQRATKAGQDKNIGHEYVKDVESRYRVEERGCVPTGWPVVDELLAGGLGKGDFGIVFGNPGGGKSWMLIALGAEAVKLGYNVLHYTLELSEVYVGRRYDASFVESNIETVSFNREKVEERIKELPGQLIVKEYSPGRASMSTIEAHIQKCKDLGFEADLIIIDYVDLLHSGRKFADKKEELDDVYTAAKSLAREMKVPVWTVSQVNRMGAKDDIIEADKAAGSYGKIMVADFAMSLSRKRQDKVEGTGRIHIMKNRYGMDGMTYAAKIDTNIGKITIEAGELDDTNMYINDGTNNSRPTGSQVGTSWSPQEKAYLGRKFFELHEK